MKPKKWDTRHYTMLAAFAGAAFTTWYSWPGLAAPELAWWFYGGEIFGGAAAAGVVVALMVR